MKYPTSAVLVATVALFVAAGCNRGGEREAGAAAQIDTTNSEQLDGLSTDQVLEQARAMSPEEAAARGMIDTTIHLENLGSQDTTPPGAAVPPGGVPAAVPPRADTVPPRPETRPGQRDTARRDTTRRP